MPRVVCGFFICPFERRSKAKEPLCHDHAPPLCNHQRPLGTIRSKSVPSGKSANRTNPFDSSVLADRKGTPEVHEKTGASKWILFQSVRLVGAVGIEPTTFGLKGRCSTTELRP